MGAQLGKFEGLALSRPGAAKFSTMGAHSLADDCDQDYNPEAFSESAARSAFADISLRIPRRLALDQPADRLVSGGIAHTMEAPAGRPERYGCAIEIHVRMR